VKLRKSGRVGSKWDERSSFRIFTTKKQRYCQRHCFIDCKLLTRAETFLTVRCNCISSFDCEVTVSYVLHYLLLLLVALDVRDSRPKEVLPRTMTVNDVKFKHVEPHDNFVLRNSLFESQNPQPR
jgi:hypothetical protein